MEQNRNQSLAHYGVLGMKWGRRKVAGGLVGGAIGSLAINGLSYASSKYVRSIARFIDGGGDLGYGIADAMSKTLSSPIVQTLAISGSTIVGSMLAEKRSKKQ